MASGLSGLGSKEAFLTLPKHLRIAEMQRWGLNTPDYEFFERGDKRVLDWRTDNDRATLRTFAPDEDRAMGRGPVLISKPPEEIYTNIRRYYRDWNLILDKDPVDPANCLFAGNVCLELHSHEGFGVGYMLVVDHHNCVVRDIEHCGQALEFNIHGNVRGPRDEIIPDLTAVVRDLMRCPYWNDLIFEFSVYPFGIGALNKHIIWWEARKKR